MSIDKTKVKLHRDIIAERLDEIADLCEYWKNLRLKGRNPKAIRMALIMSMAEVVDMVEEESRKRDNV